MFLILTKGNNFCNFFLVFLDDEILPKTGTALEGDNFLLEGGARAGWEWG